MLSRSLTSHSTTLTVLRRPCIALPLHGHFTVTLANTLVKSLNQLPPVA